MNDKITPYLDEIMSWVRASVEIVKDNAPIVIEEIIKYKTIFHAVFMSISLLISLMLCYYIAKIAKQTEKDHLLDDEDKRCLVFFISLLTAPFVCCFLYNMFCLIKIFFAPRLYLIEYLSQLIK